MDSHYLLSAHGTFHLRAPCLFSSAGLLPKWLWLLLSVRYLFVYWRRSSESLSLYLLYSAAQLVTITVRFSYCCCSVCCFWYVALLLQSLFAPNVSSWKFCFFGARRFFPLMLYFVILCYFLANCQLVVYLIWHDDFSYVVTEALISFVCDVYYGSRFFEKLYSVDLSYRLVPYNLIQVICSICST